METVHDDFIDDIQRAIRENMLDCEIQDYTLTLHRGVDFWAEQIMIVAKFANPEDLMMYRFRYLS